MKLNIGPISIEVTRSRTTESAGISQDDVKAINEDHVRYLKSLPTETFQDRLREVSFGDLLDGDRVRECLNEHGMVVVPDAIDSSVINRCKKVSEELRAAIDEFLASERRLEETDNLLLQKGHEKLKSYKELSTYGKTVVLVREAPDQGMIDVFNVDLAFPEADLIRKAYEESGLKEILPTRQMAVGFKNLNFYLNSGVTATRGFHVDSYRTQLKAFVYLTDCLSLHDGPYTYVIGSHRESSYRRMNQTIGKHLARKTETPFLNRDKILPVLARKGSLVISDQGGFHRGFPQSRGHERAITVMNIK